MAGPRLARQQLPEQRMNNRGQPCSEGGPRLVDRLLAARRARFVGRGAELDLFARALAAAEPPFAVLHVVGPGGIGKTTLLQEFASLAVRAGRPVVYIDARHLEPLPDHVLAALAQALGVQAGTVTTLSAHWPDDSILIIDTVETIAALDAWLRETLLPQLPARTLAVLAGRHAPAPAWSTDIEWAPLARVLALRNLPPDVGQSYLALRGVDAACHAQALAMTHGHPLALSLVADA
ncbi:MAG TPA: ATP-binding protein, partial [Burkholderiaceae bacterium]|nr:ATP-binding protein [Burkholderiaceae bacterium]